MTPERLSMRQTAKELGLSQLRVRELIKKGRLQADKVSDEAGERWEITRSSVEGFRADRETDGSDGRAPAAAPGPHLSVLLPELEEQLERVKTLVQEISRAQSYLDALRETRTQLELELDAVRRGVEASGTPAAEEPPEPEPEAEPEAEKKPEERAEPEKPKGKKKTATKKKSSGKSDKE